MVRLIVAYPDPRTRFQVLLLKTDTNCWNMFSVVKFLVLMTLVSSVHPVEMPSVVPSDPVDAGNPTGGVPEENLMEFVKAKMTQAKNEELLPSTCMISGTDGDALQNLRKDGDSCLASSHCSPKCERQYVDNHIPSDKEPSFTGPEFKPFQKIVYEKENNQKLFECLGNKTSGMSSVLTEQNPKYRALACSCLKKQPQPKCDKLYKYRTINGTCNSLMFPKRGSVFSCLQRFVPPNYEGVSGFRKSVCPKNPPLPEPRQLSLDIFMDQDRPIESLSRAGIYFGQFEAHDITDTPTSFVCTKPIDCCTHPDGHQHPQCAPIIIRKDDPFYSHFNVTCFNFVRAAPCDDCDTDKRNQMNQVTSFIDLSQVYGLTDEEAKSLRSKDYKGQLRSQCKNGEELMPQNPNSGIPGDCGLNHECCFLAGDRRVNQQLPLMGLHTLFLREHNSIAEELCKNNPSWDDDTIYQEARRINIAQVQAIIFNEFLPLLIQPYLLAVFQLYLTTPSTYVPALDATMWAEFNGAAYRLHSAIPRNVVEHGCKATKPLLRNNFNDAAPLYKGDMSCLMNGLCQTPAQQLDRYVTTEMTNYMYKTLRGLFGFDIASINIQRGRDMGLPTYIKMVHFWSFGVDDIKTFDQLIKYMDKHNIDLLKKIYCHVADIDLWVGLQLERPEGNTALGRTAARLVAFQFFALRLGDCFFHAHTANLDDYKPIKQVSFAGLLCKNTNITCIQKNAFSPPSATNPIVDCKLIPQVDLSKWKEAKSRPPC